MLAGKFLSQNTYCSTTYIPLLLKEGYYGWELAEGSVASSLEYRGLGLAGDSQSSVSPD